MYFLACSILPAPYALEIKIAPPEEIPIAKEDNNALTWARIAPAEDAEASILTSIIASKIE